MNIRHYIYSMLAAAAMLCTVSCDNIAEGDRLIEVAPVGPVDPVMAPRTVLVEEFSGQLCTNCPDGAKALENIQHSFGANNIVVVSIHSGVAERLGVHESKGGLATDFGEELYTKYNRVGQPNAVIDRTTDAIQDTLRWVTAISNALKVSTPLTLYLENTYNPADGTINVKVKGSSVLDLQGNVHVWLTEDGIIAAQRLASGGYNMEHVFNHIFRASMTPIDGTPVNYIKDAAEPVVCEFSIQADSKWNVANMTVVAFVDNASGVCQAVKAPLLSVREL